MVKKNKYQLEIEKILDRSEKDLANDLQSLYKSLASEITKDIAQLQKEIDTDDKHWKKLQKERLESIRASMYQQINQVEKQEKQSLWSFLKHQGDTAFNALFYEFEMSQKIPLTFAMLADKQLETIINTPVASRKLSTRLKGNATKMKKNMNRVLVRGFAKGLSTEKMALQISEVGGASYRRSMNIARTEAGRVIGVTTQKSQQDAINAGARIKKKWISTLDGSTRHTHQQLDGQVREVDEYFEIAGKKTLQPHMFGRAEEDCNCRCIAISVIKGYEPKLRRDNESKEVIEYKNYNDWLEGKKVRTSEIDPFDRISWLEKEMSKLEDEDWGDLTEDEAEELFEKYDEEYRNLKEKYGSMAYNKGEFKASSPNEITPFFKDQESYQNWINSLSEEESNLIWDYSANTYQTFNKIMREGPEAFLNNTLYRGSPDAWKQKMISDANDLAQVIKNYEADADFVTYRRIGGLYNDLSDFEIGKITDFDDGYMSTSLSLKETEEFGDGANEVLFTIHVKKGQKIGAYIGEISQYEKEKEFLIAPKTKFKILKVSSEKTEFGKRQLIELEAVE